MRTVAVAALFLGVAAHAQEPVHRYYTLAPVVDVRPVLEERVTTVPEQHCTPGTATPAWPRRETHYTTYHDHPRTPLRGIIGGLIGGLIGHQFGGGDGKTALTFAGALAGALVGDRIANAGAQHHDHYDSHEHVTHVTPALQCRTHYRNEAIAQTVGYDVTYRYQGREFTKRIDHHPGDSIRIGVSVSPAG